MAQPPRDHGTDATGSESQRMNPTPFLTKTYQLVEDSTINDVISWNEDGSSFVVWNPTVFARDLLPMYFKHSNFSSFVRQLNTYGFRKVVPDRWEFSNECFRKGEKQLLCEIQRRKGSAPAPAAMVVAEPVVVVPTAIPATKPVLSPSDSGEEQAISSQTSPSICGQNCAAEVMDENERLRKENRLLSKELTQMKSLCHNIYFLMSNYADGQAETGPRVGSHENNHSAKPLNLIPADGCCRDAGVEEEAINGEATRLFGVHLSLKRGREGDADMAEYDVQLQQPGFGAEVKPEPVGGNNHAYTWTNHNHRHGNDKIVID